MLKGNVAFITGASRGVGEAVARRLAAEGVHVVLAARDKARCQKVADAIIASGGQALAVECDISDVAQVQAAIKAAIDKFGVLDILINNAAVIEPIALVGEADPAEWAHSLSIGLIGHFNVTHAAMPHLCPGGVIVNVSSGAAQRPMEGWSAYCAGKAGLAMLTQSIALEYPPEEVRVYGYAPGTVDTDMQAVIRESRVNPISQMKKEDHAKAEMPAQVIAYLCSDEAADLAGRELSVQDKSLRRRAGLNF